MAGFEGKRAVQVGFPLTVNSYGRLADPDYERHVEQMIELVLFTAPGERVNRPDFGCGLLQLIMGPDTAAVASATEYLVRIALQKWLGEVIAVRQVEVTPTDSTLRIKLAYVLLLDQQLRVVTFEPRGAP
jgi:phage baseplate assembly protein W